MAAVWYWQLSGFSSPTRWLVAPTDRLSFTWIVYTVLGGLQGPAEYGMVAVLGLWVGLGVYQHRAELGASVDRDLCLAAAFFLGLALLLPNQHQNTIAFASRWV
jgi:hypothetical protein